MIRTRMMRRWSNVLMLAMVLATTVPWISASTAAQEERPAIAVSTPVLADIVRNVAGERAEVYSVIPESADPHTWEATPQDMTRVAAASTFIYMGASLEPFIESGGWRRAVRDSGVPELVLAEHLDLIEVDKVIDHGDHVHDLREGDPHVWLDPRMVLLMIQVIEAHLAGLDPAGAADYAASAEAYATVITELDTELERDLAVIPSERRKLIVFHDAYRYFAARYGFEVIGVVLPNLEGEPSPQDLVELITVIEETGMRVVFAEPQFNTDVLSVLVDEADVVIGELLSDAFADVVTSYVELMRFNRDSLVTHLGGA